MDKRFIVISRDNDGSEPFDNMVLPYLREHGELFGPFYPNDDRTFTAAMGRLDKNYDCYILLDERLFGTESHETVEFTRSFSPTLNHLLYFDNERQQIICEDDVAFPFTKAGLDKIFDYVGEVYAYDE